jgi:predicted amidohydrolase YtcJ
MLVYDPSATDFSTIVADAQQAQASIEGNPNLFIAGTKIFADGSTQGYTGFLSQAYFQYFAPFNWSLFPQPYAGLPNVTSLDVASRVSLSHQAGFPVIVHQNGDQAIADSLSGLQAAGNIGPGKAKDVILHAQQATPTDIAITKSLGDTMSFLIGDLYYYGVPMCEQVLDPQRSANLYPAGSAVASGVHVTLHTDTPVVPPDPLFSIWVAKTRNVQRMPWYPLTNNACGNPQGPVESISIAQGVRAFTTEAAWQYGLQDQLGKIAKGMTADMVVLSADPLGMEDNPDGLKSIRIVGTVHHGHYLPNLNLNQNPIWPGD